MACDGLTNIFSLLFPFSFVFLLSAFNDTYRVAEREFYGARCWRGQYLVRPGVNHDGLTQDQFVLEACEILEDFSCPWPRWLGMQRLSLIRGIAIPE